MPQLFQFLKSLLDLNGTASRKRGWFIFGIFVAVVLSAQAIAIYAPSLRGPVFLAFGAVSIIWIVAAVQRAHDIGRSGYWAIFAFIPGISTIAAPILLSLRRRETARKGHPIARRISAAGLCVIAILFASRAFYWQPFSIPAESMKPTLLVGDHIVITKFPKYSLQRGNVLVFHHPVNNVDMIKRLIGLPGDKIQMKDGLLYINDAVAPQVADGVFEELMEPQGPMQNRPRCENEAVEDGAICQKSRAIETLPEGASYSILNIDDESYTDNTAVFTVPEGNLFFMGDNRDNSADSRFSQAGGGLGFVPMSNVLGKAQYVIFSSAGTSMVDFASWRAERFWAAVK